MSYNPGLFTLLKPTSSATSIFAGQNAAQFGFTSSTAFANTSVYGKLISPTLLASSGGTVSFFYGQQIVSLFTSSTISTAYGLNIQGPLVTSGTVANAYSLYALAPNSLGSGNFSASYGAYFGLPSVGTQIRGGVGINTTTPLNALDVRGSVALGYYASAISASSNVLIMDGNPTSTMGIATSTPQYFMEVKGTLQAGAVSGWMPTMNQQTSVLSQCYNQSNSTGSTPILRRGFSTLSIDFFYSSQFFGTLGTGFNGAVFDGHYIYYVPNIINTSTVSGSVCRYDTAMSLTNTYSYSFFNLKTVASITYGCQGGLFDGTYVYFMFFTTRNSGGSLPFIRYDTRNPFTSSVSYAVFYFNPIYFLFGGIYDGRYIYFCSSQTSTSVVNFQYDTTQPFTLSSSYTAFTYSRGYQQQVHDGRYVYYVPNATLNNSTILRYDSTLTFSASSSYQTFNYSSVQPFANASSNPASALFDGRFVYFLPNQRPNTFLGMIRYDTQRVFTSTASYVSLNLFSIFPGTASLWGCYSGTFDGRYIYLIPGRANNLNMAIYDTSLPFGMTASYSFVNVLSAIPPTYAYGFSGSIYDGQFVYLVPGYPSGTPTVSMAAMVRIRAYSGPALSSLAVASKAGTGLILGTGIINMSTTTTAVAGSFAVPSLPAGYIILTSSQNNIFKIPYYN